MRGEAIHVWFCSPDAPFAQVLARTLGPGYDVRRGEEFTLNSAQLKEVWWDVVLLDLRSATTESSLETELRLMEEINRVELPPPIIVILGNDEHALTLKMMENGAYDTVVSPPNMVELRLVIRRAHKLHQMDTELYDLRSQQRGCPRFHQLIGSSEGMQQVFALARKIASCDVSVLVTGETGTGKELLARAIHNLSPRATGPFVAFSCASLPETLVEDELFGHEKGAFTGALLSRQGRFEAANEGTLFLDEIGDLGLGLQSKLLRVLQQRSLERLGSNASLTIDIRLVCATHQDLSEMVKQKKFREDLYYRLNVMQIHLPPLRERRDDIPVLAHHFLQQFAHQFGKKVTRISRLTLHALEEYHWPGNVRELENVVQRAVVIAERPTIELWHLPTKLRNGFEHPHPVHSYEEEVRDFKRRLILRSLRERGWRKAETARTLGMARNYLHRLINQLQIQREDTDSVLNMPDELPSANRVM